MAKNNPPVGSLPSEVADDVPAMISEGEFMLTLFDTLGWIPFMG